MRVNIGSGLLVSLYHTCRTNVRTLTATLMTVTLNNSHLQWFEADFRQQTSVGLPPSFCELRHNLSARPMLLIYVPAAHFLRTTL